MGRPRINKKIKIDLSASIVVIRNETIARKYKGGLLSFVDRFNVNCNQDLTVIKLQPGKELQDLYLYLRISGFARDLDFVVYDFDEAVPDVPWLKQDQTNQGLFLSYSPVPVTHDFIHQAHQIIGLDPSKMGEQSLRIITNDLERMYEEHGQEKALELIRVSRSHLKAQAEYLSRLAD